MSLRCPGCRTRRATFTSLLKHVQESGHKLCHCGGPAFERGLSKHRPGMRYCEHNPYGHIHLAARYGATDEELLDMMLEVVLTTPGKPATKCPF